MAGDISEETPRKIILNAVQVKINNQPLNIKLVDKPPNSVNHLSQGEKFKGNKISTAKYNLFTFIPRFLFEQFRRWVQSNHQ